MSNDHPLTVKVTDGQLQITIGIDTLKFAAEHSPNHRLCWLDEKTNNFLAFKILNEKEFAQDVANAIEMEVCCGGDGTNYLHQFLDEAIIRAIEEGSLAVSEEPEKIEGIF